eukprot:g15923.t1
MRIRFASVVSKLLAADFSAVFVGLLCLLGDSCSLGAAATPLLGEDAPTSLPRYLEWLPELESTKERALVSLARGPGPDIFFSDPIVEKLFSKRPAPVRVVVCVTSIPARLPRIHPVLRSLLAQSLPPDVLYLVVPRRYHALRGEEPAFTDVAELPATITDLEEELGRSRFRVLRPEEDRVGPLMNLWAVGQGLPFVLEAVLPEERNPATFLVTANDDHLQPVDFVRDLVVAALANPHRAVCYHGWLSIVEDQQEEGKNKITDDLPEGKGAQSLSYTMKPSEVAAVRRHIRRFGSNRTAGLVWMTQEGELASWKTPTYIQQEVAPAPAANVGGAAPKNQLQWSPRGSSAYYAAGPVGANYLGCIWQRGFFDAASFYRLPHFPQCRLVDDVWRAGLLALRAIRKQDQHYKPSAATKAIVDGSRAEQSIPLAEVRALTKEQGEFSSANMRAACHYQLVGIPSAATDSEMISFRNRGRDRRDLWRKRPRRPPRGSVAHPLDGDEMYGMLPSFPDDNIIIGIDEAGRGPVLGPMVYGLAFAPENADLKELIATELDDSKKLSLQQRESMFENVQKNVGWIAHVSSAERLSRDMTGNTKVSLNLIAQHATVNSIKYVLQQRNKNAFKKVSALYVDTVGDPERYQRILKDAFPQIPTVVVAKKADSLYKIVSAASVVAKVVRDGLLEHHQFSEERVQEVQEHPGASSSSESRSQEENGISTGRGGGVRITSRDFGCGYPGDKTTIKWLEKNLQHVFGFPKLVRFSWETADRMMEKNCAAVEFYEEAPGEANGGASGGRQLPLTAFFAKPSQPARKKAFLSRGLGIATEF